MGNAGTAQLNLQQLAMALQNLANAHTGAQLGSGADVFGSTGNDAVVPEAPAIYLQLRTDQLGRVGVTIATGPMRLFIPPAPSVRGQEAAAKQNSAGASESGEASVLHAVADVHAPDALARPSFTTATTVLQYGRELVFSRPEASDPQAGNPPRSLIPSRTGDDPSVAAEKSPAQAAGVPAREDDLQAGPAFRPPSEARVPVVVRDLLIHLQLLPPGSRTEEVLPRLQEVVRLWNQETARHSDLPPEVVRVVNHFLASAVLSAALTDPQTHGASARQEASYNLPNSRTEAREGTPALHPLFSSVPGTGQQISSARIAEAVMNLLAGAQNQVSQAQPQVLPQAPLQPQRSQQAMAGSPEGQPLPQSQRAPSVGPAPASNGRSGHGEGLPSTPRADAMVRAETVQRPVVREEIRQPRLDVRPEARSEALEQDGRPRVLSEGSYERDAREDNAYVSASELESVWPRLLESLRLAGYLSEGSVRRLADANDTRVFLALISTFVPDGHDLIDVLELVESKIGLSGTSGPLNAALERVASYRGRRGATKESALMEPVVDTMFVEGSSEEEMVILQRLEAHVPLLESFSEHADWVERLDDRAFEKPKDKLASIVEYLNTARSFHRDFVGQNRLPSPGDTSGAHRFPN